MKTFEESLMELARPLLRDQGLELVDLELSRKKSRMWLRIFIDRADHGSGGITVDECGEFNNAMSRLLDVEELVPDSYMLEVSSPGVNRRVRKLEDFLRILGQKVMVVSKEPISGRKRFRGKLVAADEQGVGVEVDDELFFIRHQDIARANLEYQFDKKKITGAGN